jgi:hypothetical protein
MYPYSLLHGAGYFFTSHSRALFKAPFLQTKYNLLKFLCCLTVKGIPASPPKLVPDFGTEGATLIRSGRKKTILLI